MADNRIGGLAAAMLLIAATAAACSSDDDMVWLTTVEVDVTLDAPPLTQLCVGDACMTFDAADEVRAASFTTDAGAEDRYEIRTTESSGEGASGPAPAGSCINVTMSTGLTEVSGCGSMTSPAAVDPPAALVRACEEHRCSVSGPAAAEACDELGNPARLEVFLATDEVIGVRVFAEYPAVNYPTTDDETNPSAPPGGSYGVVLSIACDR